MFIIPSVNLFMILFPAQKKCKEERTAVAGANDSSQNNLIQAHEKARYIHDKLLYVTIEIGYLHSSVKGGTQAADHFRENFKNCVNDYKTDENTSISELIDILIQKGHVGIGCYDTLKKLFDFDKRIVYDIVFVEDVIKTDGLAPPHVNNANLHERLAEGHTNRGKLKF